MLINMKEMLEIADQHHFAVGAFNATESSLFRAVVEEAEAQNAPAIVQVAPGEFDFATREFYSYVRERLANSPVPFVLHLDHGKKSPAMPQSNSSWFYFCYAGWFRIYL